MPGTPDDPNCMGVFFPAQELKSAFAPEETFKVDVKVSRAKASGDAIVPVKIYGNEDDYFFVSPIEFLDGQTETTCTVFFFESTPLGEEFNLTIAIEDPAYASKYNTNASYINVPIVIENYKYLGEADFSDEFEFTLTDGTVPTFKVPLYQNVMAPNEFRLIEPYKEGNAMAGWTSTNPAPVKFNFKIIEPGFVVNKGTKYEFTIKGEDLVYFEDYYTGDSSNGIDIVAYSPFQNSTYYIGTSESDCADSKVVNYQDPDAEGNVLPAVVQLMPTYLLGDGSGRGWGAYPVIIRFPGGEFVDYTLEISTAECKEGKLPVTFDLGKDVKAVKYLVYPGELTAKEIRQETALIGAGEKEAESLDLTLPRILVECEETGLYTIVAVAFDKNGDQQSGSSAVFGYVKPGDEEDVAIVFDAAIEPTPARYEKDGYTTANSMLFYMVGDDVTSVRCGLFKTEDFEEDPDSIVEEVANSGTQLTDDQLEKVNQPGGYVDLFTKLSPLTSYTLVVYAFNGYTGKTVVRALSTAGLPLEKVGEGSYNYALLAPLFSAPSTYCDDMPLYFDPNTEDEYSIPDFWIVGNPLEFTRKGKDVNVAPSYVGSVGVELYVAEFKTYVDLYAQAAEVTPKFICEYFDAQGFDFTHFYTEEHSSYDPEKDVYKYCLAYFDGNTFGFYKYGYETFAMYAKTEAAKAPAVKSVADLNLNNAKAVESVNIPAEKKLRARYGVNFSVEREIKAANIEVKASEAVSSVMARNAKPVKFPKR